MANVKVFEQSYQASYDHQFGVGEHKITFPPCSMVVPTGLIVRIYKGDSVADVSTDIFWEGAYNDLSFYVTGNLWDWNPCVLEITETTATPENLATFSWPSYFSKTDYYTVFQKVHIGQENVPDIITRYGKDVSSLQVPEHSEFTMYKGTQQSGSHLKLEPGTHDIADFLCKSYNFTTDTWKLVGTFLDFDNAIELDDSDPPRAQTAKADNPSDLDAEINISVSDGFQMEMTSEWDVEASTTIGVEVEGSGIFASVTAEASATVGGGYGQSSSDGESVELTASGTVEVPAHSEAEITMLTTVGKRKIPSSETYEDERTGERIEIKGSITTKYASESHIQITGGQVPQGDTIETNGKPPTSVESSPTSLAPSS